LLHAPSYGVAVGTFGARVEIGDIDGVRWEPIEALVDTGATYTTVPASLLDRPGVRPHGRVTFLLADGRQVEEDIGRRAQVTLARSSVDNITPVLRHGLPCHSADKPPHTSRRSCQSGEEDRWDEAAGLPLDVVA